MSRDERGWQVEGYGGATRKTFDVEVDVAAEKDGLRVRLECGTGFQHQSDDAFIPLHILRAVFEQVGLSIVSKEAKGS